MDEDTESSVFDLESYINNYTSHTKVERLLFIADKAAGKPLALEALKLAADELKKSDNTGAYQEVCSRIGDRLGSAYQLDRSFVEAVDRRAAVLQERLESELHGFKTNLIKESIRMGHNELGDFFYRRGDLQNAYKCYVRTRDYCTTSKHLVGMCLNAIKVTIELGNFMHVQNYVTKAEQTPDVQQDPIVVAKLKAAAGLAFLDGKKYKAAARKFVEVNPDLGSDYSDVIAPQDIAVYGSLCALATMDRGELRSKVVNNIGFREFLEVIPEVREVIYDFYGSKYASCLSHLDQLRETLMYDIHLHDHVQPLYDMIRQKALVMYATPFTSVDLKIMATAFNITTSQLEKELAALIMDHEIQARIDSHNKILYARHAHVRNNTFRNALQIGESYVRESKALLLRANVLQHDLVQRGGGRTRGPGGTIGPSILNL